MDHMVILGFPGGSVVQNLQCGRPRFDPSVRKIPWRRAWQPTQILAWRIPWLEEPGGLQSVGSEGVGHD